MTSQINTKKDGQRDILLAVSFALNTHDDATALEQRAFELGATSASLSIKEDQKTLTLLVTNNLADGTLWQEWLELDSTPDIKPIPDINWLNHVYEALPAMTIGRFYVHGSHDTTIPPKDLICLQIDAATAFGSGKHGTTSGCLEMLSASNITPANVLDMGCGSGILAIAAKKLWPEAAVTGSDNDPECEIVSNHHADLNTTAVTFQTGDGYADITDTYDLIIANITSLPLITMAGDLARHLNKNGHAILSGLLNEQVNAVTKAHNAHGLHVKQSISHEGWSTLLLSHIR